MLDDQLVTRFFSELRARMESLEDRFGKMNFLVNSPQGVYNPANDPPVGEDDIGFSDITLNGVTFTNNSPGAGKVAWTDGAVGYRGAVYGVATGDTGTDVWLYWDELDPGSIKTSATPLMLTTQHIIGLNLTGVFNPAFVLRASTGAFVLIAPESIRMYDSGGSLILDLP